MIEWDRFEEREQPTVADIASAVKEVKQMPGAGDQQHVAAQFDVYGKPMPATPNGAWANAELKTIKFKKLQATNAQLDRANLIWHLQHPGQSKMRSPHNTHPQVIKTDKGDYLIADGHHRLSALRLLGVKRDSAWILKEGDMSK